MFETERALLGAGQLQGWDDAAKRTIIVRYKLRKLAIEAINQGMLEALDRCHFVAMNVGAVLAGAQLVRKYPFLPPVSLLDDDEVPTHDETAEEPQYDPFTSLPVLVFVMPLHDAQLLLRMCEERYDELRQEIPRPAVTIECQFPLPILRREIFDDWFRNVKADNDEPVIGLKR